MQLVTDHFSGYIFTGRFYVQGPRRPCTLLRLGRCPPDSTFHRAGLAVRHEDVALSPDRLDITRIGWVGFEQAPQPPYGHVETAVPIRSGLTAQLLVQLRTREYDHLVFHEDLQRRKFAGTQRHPFAVVTQLARGKIDFIGAKAVRRPVLRRARRRRVATSQDRADAGKQFAWIEGFGQVIVRAQFEPDHAVDYIRTRRQEDHGDVVAGRTQFAQRTDAVLLGHHHVEHDD